MMVNWKNKEPDRYTKKEADEFSRRHNEESEPSEFNTNGAYRSQEKQRETMNSRTGTLMANAQMLVPVLKDKMLCRAMIAHLLKGTRYIKDQSVLPCVRVCACLCARE